MSDWWFLSTMVGASFLQQLTQLFPGPGKDYSHVPHTDLEFLGYLFIGHFAQVAKTHNFSVPAGQFGKRPSKVRRQFAILCSHIRRNIPAHGFGKLDPIAIAQHVTGAAAKAIDATQDRQLLEQGGPAMNRSTA